MNAAPDHLATVRNMRALAGRSDPRIDDLHAAARRLEQVIDGWRTFGPRPSSLLDAATTIEGMARTLADLRHGTGGPRDAA